MQVRFKSLLQDKDITRDNALATILYHQQKGARLLLESVSDFQEKVVATLYSFTPYKDGYLIDAVEKVDEAEVKDNHYLSYAFNSEQFAEFLTAIDNRLSEIAEEDSEDEEDDKEKILSEVMQYGNIPFFNLNSTDPAKELKKVIKTHVVAYGAIVDILEDVFVNQHNFPDGLEQFKHASPVYERPQVGMKL